MSEDRKRGMKEAVREEIESLGLTADDIRRFFHLISAYYYYEVEVKGKTPADVVMEVQPAPADVRNVGAFLVAWRHLMAMVMRDVAAAIRSLTPEEEAAPRTAEEMMRYMLWQAMRGRAGGKEEEEEEAELPEVGAEETEALRRSIEKVKKMAGAKEGGGSQGAASAGS